MEMVEEFLTLKYIKKKDPLPFPDYLLPQNRHKNDFWITLEGECIYPRDMEDRHLINTIQLIHRSNPRIKQRYKSCGADRHILQGMAPWHDEEVSHPITRQLTGEKEYRELWEVVRIYMLLRREVKLRGLEEHII